MASSRALLGSLGIVSMLGVGGLACSSKDGTGLSGSGGGNSEASGTGTANGPAGQTTGDGLFAGSNGASGTGGAASCGQSTIQAQLAPLTMFIMFDKSGSMSQNNKWTNSTAALQSFFQDPGAAGLEVALRFFPDGACDGDQCNINACATPQVDAAALTADPAPTDNQEKLLVAALASKSPGGNTPMSAALAGATKWGEDYFAAHTDHKVVVVLVTDGEPSGCINNVDQIAQIAADGNTKGVQTFTVGLQGSGTNTLNQIAAAGGTTQGFFIGNGNAEAELIQALEAIRGKAIACSLQIPAPTQGQTFDPTQVNVDFTPSGGQAQTLGNVPDKAACGPSGGWYYDDVAAPTKILLCPTTCDGVQADSMGKLDIVLGCSTVPA